MFTPTWGNDPSWLICFKGWNHPPASLFSRSRWFLFSVDWIRMGSHRKPPLVAHLEEPIGPRIGGDQKELLELTWGKKQVGCCLQKHMFYQWNVEMLKDMSVYSHDCVDCHTLWWKTGGLQESTVPHPTVIASEEPVKWNQNSTFTKDAPKSTNPCMRPRFWLTCSCWRCSWRCFVFACWT